MVVRRATATTSRRSRDEDYADEEEIQKYRDRANRGRLASARDYQEDEDEAPRRSRRARDDDGDEDDEPPRRSRRAARDEDEDETPRRRTASRRDDGDEKPARRTNGARRTSRRDDEDEKPRRGKGGTDNSGSGWEAAKRVADSVGTFTKWFKFDEEQQLVKFLEDAPFHSYSEHWIDDLKGKKSFTCLGKGCPLCDMGERPRAYFLFNIVTFDDRGPVNEPMRVGVKAMKQLNNFNSDKKTGPLSKNYWAVSASGAGGKGNTYTNNFLMVKERDLEEDWETEPLTDDELDELDENKFDASVVESVTKRQLQDVADLLMDS